MVLPMENNGDKKMNRFLILVLFCSVMIFGLIGIASAVPGPIAEFSASPRNRGPDFLWLHLRMNQ